MDTPAGHYDVIVAGAGGMGSAVAYHLPRRRCRVLAIDRYNPPHEMGSSHGLTRIIRLAYHEDPSYVPLLRRAYALWREFGAHRRRAACSHITGSLEIGLPGGEIFDGALASCRIHDLSHEILTRQQITPTLPRLPAAAAIRRDFPAGRRIPGPGTLHRRAPDPGQARTAPKFTRTSRSGIWEAAGDGVRVRTDRAAYSADRLVITAGAWLPKLVPPLAQASHPGAPGAGLVSPAASPSASRPRPSRCSFSPPKKGNFYGFPMYGLPGLKIGLHHHFEEVVDPDTMDRTGRRPRRGGAAGLCSALPPRRRGRDAGAQDLSVHQHTGPALHCRPPSRIPAGRDRRRILGARLQVLQRHGRNPGRPGPDADDIPRDRSIQVGSILVDTFPGFFD